MEVLVYFHQLIKYIAISNQYCDHLLSSRQRWFYYTVFEGNSPSEFFQTFWRTKHRSSVDGLASVLHEDTHHCTVLQLFVKETAIFNESNISNLDASVLINSFCYFLVHSAVTWPCFHVWLLGRSSSMKTTSRQTSPDSRWLYPVFCQFWADGTPGQLIS